MADASVFCDVCLILDRRYGPRFCDPARLNAINALLDQLETEYQAMPISGGRQPAAASERPDFDSSVLSDDLADAFESFKLAINRQRAMAWDELDRATVVTALESLQRLCT